MRVARKEGRRTRSKSIMSLYTFAAVHPPIPAHCNESADHVFSMAAIAEVATLA